MPIYMSCKRAWKYKCHSTFGTFIWPFACVIYTWLQVCLTSMHREGTQSRECLFTNLAGKHWRICVIWNVFNQINQVDESFFTNAAFLSIGIILLMMCEFCWPRKILLTNVTLMWLLNSMCHFLHYNVRECKWLLTTTTSICTSAMPRCIVQGRANFLSKMRHWL